MPSLIYLPLLLFAIAALIPIVVPIIVNIQESRRRPIARAKPRLILIQGGKRDAAFGADQPESRTA